MTTVLGVDARKGGWVGIVLEDGRFSTADSDAALDALIERHPHVSAVAVDMPIGLDRGGRRDCDLLAREKVGARRSSVFLTTTESVLAAASHKEATALSLGQTGRGVSQQSWALRCKIREVAQLVDGDQRIFEVHPEVSFHALAGSEVEWSKKTWAGQAERRQLLEEAGIELPVDLGRASDVPADDVLDAAAAAWTADRYARGKAESLPPGARPRACMVIWY